MPAFAPQHTTAVRQVVASRRRGRPRGIGHCRARKRLSIAQAVVAGKSITAVARELGVSRSWVHREAHAPETCAFIDELMLRHKDHFEALFPAALDALRSLFQARKFAYVGSTVIDLGPDHRVRLKAVGLFLKLLKVIGKIQTSRTGPAVHQFLRVLISIAEIFG